MAIVRDSASGSRPTLRANVKLATTPRPAAIPAGTAKRPTSKRKPSDRKRPSLGASARKKDGMPIVSPAASVRWRGSSGYACGVSPIESTTNAANADFVTKSFATRCRLRSTFRPSATSAGTLAKSPRTSTRSATLRAICEPLPCAIASRAAFSAGTSLTPSPTIAT